jgi:hypothetical protein
MEKASRNQPGVGSATTLYLRHREDQADDYGVRRSLRQLNAPQHLAQRLDRHVVEDDGLWGGVGGRGWG